MHFNFTSTESMNFFGEDVLESSIGGNDKVKI
jgi:hypothetical protein